MQFLRRRSGQRGDDQGTTTESGDRGPDVTALRLQASGLAGAARYGEAIDLLNRANRISRDPDIESEVRDLRHRAGIELASAAPKGAAFPAPASSPPLGADSGLPEIDAARLTPEILRGAILTYGSLLVRGILPVPAAEQMAADIERAFALRTELGRQPDGDGFYDELRVIPPFEITVRRWIEMGGGLLAVDSPRLLFDMIETFDRAGLREVIEGYLGERAELSAHKTTLRKATPDVGGAWHQDGRFLGEVRSLNVWLSLSHCGVDAPGLDVVPRRFDQLVETETEGAILDYQVSDTVAMRAAEGVGVVRPVFAPGDALLFDEKTLHETGSDPAMPKARYSIESWFFGASEFPGTYVPVAF